MFSKQWFLKFSVMKRYSEMTRGWLLMLQTPLLCQTVATVCFTQVSVFRDRTTKYPSQLLFHIGTKTKIFFMEFLFFHKPNYNG